MNAQPGGMATNQSNICYKCSRSAQILSSIRGWITKLLLARKMFDNSSRRVPRWRMRPPETQRLRLDEALSEKNRPMRSAMVPVDLQKHGRGSLLAAARIGVQS